MIKSTPKIKSIKSLLVQPITLALGSLAIHVQAGQSICASNPAIMGYSDVATLTADMLLHRRDFSSYIINGNNPIDYQRRSFTLCPDTVFSFDGGSHKIPIFAPNTEIRCGSDGKATDNCIFSGGSHHIYIYGDYAINGLLLGLTFIKSTHASILAVGSDKSNATFIDCHWKNNAGQATILNHLNPLEDDDTSTESFPVMDIHIINSSFKNNKNKVAIISTSSSEGLVITNTVFQGNIEPIIEEDNTIKEIVSITQNKNGAAHIRNGNLRRI